MPCGPWSVVYEYVLVGVGTKAAKNGFHPFVHLGDIRLFVVARRHTLMSFIVYPPIPSVRQQIQRLPETAVQHQAEYILGRNALFKSCCLRRAGGWR